MNDLFRFMILRPATPVAPDAIKTLTPSFVDGTPTISQARRAAENYV